MASEPRCSKPGCGARKIVGKPCADADCPQQWVHHTDTRPAPAATDTGLVTVAKQWKVTAKNWSGLKPEISEPFDERELVTRSQADELLAAERAEHDKTIATLAKNVLRVAELTDECTALKADNAAKDARIKELEEALDSDPSGSDLWRYWSRKACEASQKYVDEVDRAEALEAKLEDAEKALEPFADHAKERAVDAPEWRDTDTVQIVVTIGDLRKARAALGGKPS